MKGWRRKLCALLLAVTMMPGAFEVLENAGHLLAAGHLAHAAARGDHHQPPGPEHGCTPTSHLCPCHASLAFLVGPTPPRLALHAAGLLRRQESEPQLTGLWPAGERPPQV
ncbi:MAG: hypothetical protein D6696_00975 [Acidobacteria bacterium]|nr:MAG: hypothetical protein D6696_00975 [Acidobacteriota bacterium]